jgi:hypothetical protein
MEPRHRTLRISLLVLFILLALVSGIVGVVIPGWGSYVGISLSAASLILSAIPVFIPIRESPPLLTLKKTIPAGSSSATDEFTFFREQLEQEHEPLGLGAIAVYGSQPLIGLDVHVEGPNGRLPTTYIAMHPGRVEPIYAAVFNHVPPGDYYITVNNMAQTVLQTIKKVQAGKVTEIHVPDRQPSF